ncbi:MAG: DNA polymerase III subunit epsilon [Flavobacteriaceae bacterium]|nr:DNA polymerase III subunit epsilon [Flavobacteriaceae bacterium]|tara:strand:- start:54953 stop:55609 length:657 start_codon:yes stop_codon:yes gene_type:complete
MFWNRKKYPEFWNAYANSFQHKSPAFEELRFVVFDTETSGLNPKEDALLSIGAIGVRNKMIRIQDHFEAYVNPKNFKKETVEIHGIRRSGENKISEEEGIKNFLGYLNNAVLVAHHAAFDVAMINAALKRMGLPKLKNQVIDTGNLFLKSDFKEPYKEHYSLDHLAKTFNIALHDRHNAAGDAYITAQIFVKLLLHLEKKNTLSLSFLKRPAKRIGLL